MILTRGVAFIQSLIGLLFEWYANLSIPMICEPWSKTAHSCMCWRLIRRSFHAARFISQSCSVAAQNSNGWGTLLLVHVGQWYSPNLSILWAKCLTDTRVTDLAKMHTAPWQSPHLRTPLATSLRNAQSSNEPHLSIPKGKITSQRTFTLWPMCLSTDHTNMAN